MVSVWPVAGELFEPVAADTVDACLSSATLGAAPDPIISCISRLACDSRCVARAWSRSFDLGCARVFRDCDTSRLWKVVVALETGFSDVLVLEATAFDGAMVVDATTEPVGAWVEAGEVAEVVDVWLVEDWPALLDGVALVEEDDVPD